MFAAGEELETVLEQVRRLHTLGISTVPVCRPTPAGWCSARWHLSPCDKRGKRPLVAGYRERAHSLQPLEDSLAEIRFHWPCGIGMVVPVGCMVVEADSPAAEAELLALGGAIMKAAPARERRPGRGRGWIFRVAAGIDLRTATRCGESEAIDILAAGSLYVVPPSIHKTMHVLTWVPGRAPWEVPIPYVPQPILALAQARAPARRASPEVRVDSSNSFEPRISPRVGFLLAARSDLRRLWGGEKAWGDASASGVDYAVVVALLDARVPPDQAAEALAARPGVHRATAEYCLKTVQKAQRRHP